MGELITLISSYSLVQILVIIVLSFAAIKWIVQQIIEIKDKIKKGKEEYHQEENEKELKAEEINERFEKIETYLNTDYEKIINTENHLYQIEESLKNVQDTLSDMEIQSLRKQILNFTQKATDMTNANVSREEYSEIGRAYEKYEKALEKAGKENGYIDFSYKCILHSFETRNKNGLFLEDFYISPAEAIDKIKSKNDIKEG